MSSDCFKYICFNLKSTLEESIFDREVADAVHEWAPPQLHWRTKYCHWRIHTGAPTPKVGASTSNFFPENYRKEEMKEIGPRCASPAPFPLPVWSSTMIRIPLKFWFYFCAFDNPERKRRLCFYWNLGTFCNTGWKWRPQNNCSKGPESVYYQLLVFLSRGTMTCKLLSNLEKSPLQSRDLNIN